MGEYIDGCTSTEIQATKKKEKEPKRKIANRMTTTEKKLSDRTKALMMTQLVGHIMSGMMVNDICPSSDDTRTKYNKYAVEKAKILYEMIEESL